MTSVTLIGLVTPCFLGGNLTPILVSDGSGRPYRVRVRPPCFFGMAALGQMLKGHLVSDIITTFGMINMIGGECDR